VVTLAWYNKFFSARPKAIPAPTAETSAADTFSPLSKMLPRRYRTYGLNKNKQKQLRNLSRNGIVRRGIERIKRGVLSLDYQLTPIGKVSNKQMEQIKLRVDNVLQSPNIIHNYEAFFDMILEDLITLDAGVFNIVKGGNPMRPIFLYPVDATTIEILQPYDFTNPDGDRYVQRVAWQYNEKTFSTNDMAYLQINHFTDNCYGLSAVEKLWRYLNYFMDALDNAADIASADTPKFLIAIKDAESGKLKEFRVYMQNEIEGTGHIPIVGGDVDSKQIGAISADSLFLEWQKFLLTLVAKCFDLPESFFISADVNDRNNLSEVEQQVLMEAIKPYAKVIERAINVHVLQAMGIYNVKFEFKFEQTETEKKAKEDRVGNKYLRGIITRNQALEELGYPKSDSKYADLDTFEAKAKLNKDYAVNTGGGGFNGQGSSKDSYSDKPTVNKTG
jgi:HK97 family phage portal protein